MCVYTYVVCVCANVFVYGMYKYVSVYAYVYVSLPPCRGVGVTLHTICGERGGAVNTKHGTMYIYIYNIISTLFHMYLTNM